MTEHVSVRLPASLRHFAGGAGDVGLDAATVGEALERLVAMHPSLRDRILAGDGRVRSFVRVFVNSRDVRELDEQSTSLRAGDVLVIVPAIAGG